MPSQPRLSGKWDCEASPPTRSRLPGGRHRSGWSGTPAAEPADSGPFSSSHDISFSGGMRGGQLLFYCNELSFQRRTAGQGSQLIGSSTIEIIDEAHSSPI